MPTPLDQHLSTVRARVREADALADWVRHDRVLKLHRGADLDDAIAQLEQARQPLTAYVRHLRQLGRLSDPVWQANEDATRVLRRLRAMRRRYAEGKGTGTPRTPAPAADRQTVEGACGRTEQVLNELEAELSGMRKGLGRGVLRTMPNGGQRLSMAPLNEEAADLLPRLDRARHALNVHWQRYERAHPARLAEADNPYEAQDEHDALWSKVDRLRDAASDLKGQITAAATQTTPPAPQDVREPWERWTADDVVAAWVAFRERRGRWPTKAEHHPDNGLPHATQLRRIMGPSPLAAAREQASALVD